MINIAKAIIKDIASNVVIIVTTSLLFLVREANTELCEAEVVHGCVRILHHKSNKCSRGLREKRYIFTAFLFGLL